MSKYTSIRTDGSWKEEFRPSSSHSNLTSSDQMAPTPHALMSSTKASLDRTDGQLQSMDKLLKAGAHADARSDMGETPLMLATQQGNAEACSKLLMLVCQLPKELSCFLYFECIHLMQLYAKLCVLQPTVSITFPFHALQTLHLRLEAQFQNQERVVRSDDELQTLGGYSRLFSMILACIICTLPVVSVPCRWHGSQYQCRATTLTCRAWTWRQQIIKVGLLYIMQLCKEVLPCCQCCYRREPVCMRGMFLLPRHCTQQ